MRDDARRPRGACGTTCAGQLPRCGGRRAEKSQRMWATPRAGSEEDVATTDSWGTARIAASKPPRRGSQRAQGGGAAGQGVVAAVAACQDGGFGVDDEPVGGLLAGADFLASTAAQFAESTNAMRANGSGRRSSAHWPRRRHTAGVPLRSVARGRSSRACASTRCACASSGGRSSGGRSSGCRSSRAGASTRRDRASSGCRKSRARANTRGARARSVCRSSRARASSRRAHTGSWCLSVRALSPLAAAAVARRDDSAGVVYITGGTVQRGRRRHEPGGAAGAKTEGRW